MKPAINCRAKRLIISLFSISALGGCAAYWPADPYNSYPANPYGQSYYAPPSYYGPEAGIGYGYYDNGHGWRDGRDSGGNDGKPEAGNGWPQARHGLSGLRERVNPNAGNGNQGDMRGGRGDH